MKISIDNGGTYKEVPFGVRVIYDDVVDGSNGNVELHVNCTDEGLILDVFDTTDDSCFGTSSEMAQEIVERLVD